MLIETIPKPLCSEGSCYTGTTLSLAEHQGIVLSRQQLLNLVWGYDFYGETRTVDIHIAQLRRRLASSSAEIETVLGVGYKLVAGP